jgi:hypothetical protein
MHALYQPTHTVAIAQNHALAFYYIIPRFKKAFEIKELVRLEAPQGTVARRVTN